MALVEIKNLSVDYRSRDQPQTHAVRDVSFDIDEGEFVGLLGESGCGKSTLGNAMLSLLDKPAYLAGGQVLFDGTDLCTLDERDLNALRWRDISTVFQSSMNALNPVMRIVRQFEDAMDAHGWDSKELGSRHERIVQVLRDVELDAERVMRSYPHELSGGMRQRVVLALALLLRPRLIILDEPTTGLDVVVQRSIVTLLRRLQEDLGFSVLFISHDLGTVLEIADRVMVMYAGEIVEVQRSAEIAANPLHPYTQGLLGSFGDPRAEHVAVTYIPGRPPSLVTPPHGCPFAPRCPVSTDVCRTAVPELRTMAATLPPPSPVEPSEQVQADAAQAQVRCHLVHPPARGAGPAGADEASLPPSPRPAAPVARFATVTAWTDGDSPGPAAPTSRGGPHDEPAGTGPDRAGAPTARQEPLVVVEHLTKTYRRRRGLTSEPVHAVRDVSFTLTPGRVEALVGQSGSGKSTIAKMLTGTERPTSGLLTVDGAAVTGLRGRALRRHCSTVQMVFQDPFAALNPTKTIGASLSRPLKNLLGLSGDALRARTVELLETVGLSPAESFVDKLPHQLSGGQRQRVVIARAMAPEPRLLVADEPISMLDVSIRAEILELLATMVRERDVAMLYITHDLLSARLLADGIMVMHEGQVVERGPTVRVVREPGHSYTRTLLDSIPNPFTDTADVLAGAT